jgi:hypothetical protein
MKKIVLSPAAAFASGTIPIKQLATAKARLAVVETLESSHLGKHSNTFQEGNPANGHRCSRKL